MDNQYNKNMTIIDGTMSLPRPQRMANIGNDRK